MNSNKSSDTDPGPPPYQHSTTTLHSNNHYYPSALTTVSSMSSTKVDAMTLQADLAPESSWHTSQDRERDDNLANLYAIIKTTEALERLYARDAIPKSEYKEQCKKLISQFRTSQRLTNVNNVQFFMDKYNLKCPVAYHRLVESGLPDAGESNDNSNKLVAETVQYFISILDSVKLKMLAADELHPPLDSLMDRLNQFPIPPPSDIIVRVQKWLKILNHMNAHDMLDDEQARQMAFDIDMSYDAFHKYLDSR